MGSVECPVTRRVVDFALQVLFGGKGQVAQRARPDEEGHARVGHAEDELLPGSMPLSRRA